MKKTKLLLTLLCLWVGLLPALAQSVTIVKEMQKNPYANVLVMYKNDFGSFEKPDMSITFPYALIRMQLEGNAHEVKAAKERLTLYMGQLTGVEARVTTYSNQILFLLRAPRHPMIYIDGGDGCDQVLLSNMQQLQPNCLYDCTVRFMPENLNNEEAIDKEKLKQELLAELAVVLKDQETNITTQSTDTSSPISSNPSISKSNEEVNDTLNLIPNKHNGYEYVDLGLSVKWATCNVGASKPEDYGDYFAWGETSTKSTYKSSTYKWCNGTENTLTKYNTSSSTGTVDNKTQLDLSDDAARANWGGSWRMPTDTELTELREQCTWRWTTQNGVKGCKVTSKSNGNSIFLPAAGYREGSSHLHAGSRGTYWSSSLRTGYAWYVNLGFDGVYRRSNSRRFGFTVRPVCP